MDSNIIELYIEYKFPEKFHTYFNYIEYEFEKNVFKVGFMMNGNLECEVIFKNEIEQWLIDTRNKTIDSII